MQKTFFLDFLLKTGRQEYEGKMLEKMNSVYSSRHLFPQEFEKGYGYVILKLTLKRISVHIAFP